MKFKPLAIVSYLCVGIGVASSFYFTFAHRHISFLSDGNMVLPTKPVAAWQDEVGAMAREMANTDTPDRMVEHVYRVKRGDTLIDMLVRRAQVPRQQAQGAVDALRAHYDPKELKPGQDLAVIFEKDDQPKNKTQFVGFHFKPSADKRFQVARLQDGGFSAKSINAPVRQETVRSEGVIRGSLMAAAAAASIPNSITMEAINAFSHDVDFQRDLQPGDRFVAVYDRTITNDGAVIDSGKLKYASLTVDGEKKEIFRYLYGNGQNVFFDAEGRSIRRSLMRTPINGARITSGFGMRQHPVLGYSKMHRGVDFAAPTGTPIYASGDGIIEKFGLFGAYGNYVRIRHNNNISTAYAHLSRFNKNLRPGSRVKQGTIIGFVGTTGRSTGPHLHYEVLKANNQVNPLTVVAMAGDNLSGKDLKRFQQNVASIRQESRRLSVAYSGTNAEIKTSNAPPLPERPPENRNNKFSSTRKQIANNPGDKNSDMAD
jgi:murein DD-endopeptidase MepM/ murein hydrolase activator NlpD